MEWLASEEKFLQKKTSLLGSGTLARRKSIAQGNLAFGGEKKIPMPIQIKILPKAMCTYWVCMVMHNIAIRIIAYC